MDEKIRRWRLILGNDTDDEFAKMSDQMGETYDIDEETMVIDNALALIYDETSKSTDLGSKNFGKAKPNLSRWLGDVRKFFPEDVVSIIQSDAIERKGFNKLLLEPETLKSVKPDIAMVSTLLSLKGQIPEKSKDAARQLIKSVVDEIMKRLESDLKRAVVGAVSRKNHSPIAHFPSTDWKRTIIKNLKNYDIKSKRIIPEKFYFFERTNKSNMYKIIIDIDQSGSMASSIIYASVMSSIFASMPVLDTKVVAFDTEIVDLTEAAKNDPVDILFGIQLGGGTDINKSLAYCINYIEEPSKTMFILISDLYEGGVESGLLKKLEYLKQSDVKVMVLLALSDEGKPYYNENLGKRIVSLGIPAFACSPDKLPELVEGALKGYDLMELSKKLSQKLSQK